MWNSLAPLQLSQTGSHIRMQIWPIGTRRSSRRDMKQSSLLSFAALKKLQRQPSACIWSYLLCKDFQPQCLTVWKRFWWGSQNALQAHDFDNVLCQTRLDVTQHIAGDFVGGCGSRKRRELIRLTNLWYPEWTLSCDIQWGMSRSSIWRGSIVLGDFSTAYLDERPDSQIDRVLIKKIRGLKGFYLHTQAHTSAHTHTSDVGGEMKRWWAPCLWNADSLFSTSICWYFSSFSWRLVPFEWRTGSSSVL